MRRLNLYRTDDVDRLTWPEVIQHVDLYSPALTVFTDFTVHKPLVVSHNMHAVDVEASMRRQHVRLKLVVDDYEAFLGVVSLEDLNEEEVLKRVAQGYDRHELVVTDFMRSKHAIHSLDYEEFENANICDLLKEVKSLDYQHCLVLDRKSQRVRGMVSASDVVRKLKLAMDLTRHATFANIYRTLHTAPQTLMSKPHIPTPSLPG